MAVVTELGLVRARVGEARESFGKRFRTLFRREDAWQRADRSSFLLVASDCLSDFGRKYEQNTEFLDGLDNLTRIYRMPVKEIIDGMKEKITYNGVIGKMLNYLTYEYMSRMVRVGRDERISDVEATVEKSIKMLTKNELQLEILAGEDCKNDLIRRSKIPVQEWSTTVFSSR